MFSYMRYNSKSLEIKVVISGNASLFKDTKISFGLWITARKMQVGKIATSKCQQIIVQIIEWVSAVEPKIPGKQILVLTLQAEVPSTLRSKGPLLQGT